VELQSQIDAWVELTYSNTPHSGIGMDGMTPAEKAAASLATIHTVDERALDVLLMPAPGNSPYPVLSKRGFPVNNFHYQTGAILAGRRALIRLDPMDAGVVYAFSEDGTQFLAKAVCAELAGVNPVSLLKAAREQQKEIFDDALRPIKRQLRKLNSGPSLIQRALEVDRRDAEKRACEAANVIRLPKREEQHSTAAIAAALDAVTAPRVPEARSLNEKAAELHVAIVREAERRSESKVIHLDPDAALSEGQRKFKWAKALEAAIAAGVKVSDDEAVRLVNYQGSTDYQVRMDLLESFDMAAALAPR